LRDLLTDGRGRVVGITVAAPDGTLQSYGAALVVGADGIGSSVARLVQARQIRRGTHAAANIFGHFPGMGNEGYHWYYRPGVSAGMIPTNDGLNCVFVAAPKADFDADLRHDIAFSFLQLLTAANPTLGGRITRLPLGPLSVFRGRPGYLREAHGSGWALVGDAGFFRDPLTAHGITDALRDAEGLAIAIIRGTHADMRRYQSERDALALPLLTATDSIASFSWDLETLRGLHKELNQAMKAEMGVIAECGAATDME
jgi:2-polyprenyl-6-methoxyphenol hydroxylase-like FAD-dependent oxidoreductase